MMAAQGSGVAPKDPKDLYMVVGMVINVVTTADERIMGEVYSYDPVTTCLVLREIPQDGAGLPPGGKRGTFRILKRSYIKSFKYVRGEGAAPGPLPPIEIKKVVQREHQKELKHRAEKSRINSAVTSEVQAIFNALSKTLPCEWGPNNTIVVLESVVISAPYTPESCSAKEEHTLRRVRLVLEGERKRLGHDQTQ